MGGLTEILMRGLTHIPDPGERRNFATAIAFGLADLYALRGAWEE